jgi:hypothetical protein
LVEVHAEQRLVETAANQQTQLTYLQQRLDALEVRCGFETLQLQQVETKSIVMNPKPACFAADYASMDS